MNRKSESATPVLDHLCARELEILGDLESFITNNRVVTAIAWGLDQSATVRACQSAASAYAVNRQSQTEELDRIACRWAGRQSNRHTAPVFIVADDDGIAYDEPASFYPGES